MRAKSTLALICFLLGTTAMIQSTEAATTPTRSAQKQPRVTMGTATPPASPARPTTTARAGKNDQNLARSAASPAQPRTAQSRSNTAPVALARANNARGSRVVSAGVSRSATARVAMPAPGQAARSLGMMPVAMPVIARPAQAATHGTPILHVAQDFGLSCVPFARMATGMNISGNGGHWWYNAAGVYARGQQPERGAILSFPGSGAMRSGHVAVVSRVVNSRTIEIDHSNWGGPGLRRGQVLRGAVVVDVSDRNDWTAVRHQVGFDRSSFGRTYPTHGFIYNRPAGSRDMVAQAGRFQEVADAASPHATQHMRLSAQAFGQ